MCVFLLGAVSAPLSTGRHRLFRSQYLLRRALPLHQLILGRSAPRAPGIALRTCLFIVRTVQGLNLVRKA